MRAYVVTYFMVSAGGRKLGFDPLVFRFYAPSSFDTCSLSFQRLLLEYGRAIGRSGSCVEIISVEK